jgi:RNase P subunit RPR2
MGKRFDKKKHGKKKASREGDAALRITYLWSAAHVMSQSAPCSSRFYVGCIKQVGRCVTLPLDATTMKRGTCKNCNALLLPGQHGTTFRVVPRRETHVVVTCGSCKALRRYLARPRSRDLEKTEVRRAEDIDLDAPDGSIVVAGVAKDCDVTGCDDVDVIPGPQRSRGTAMLANVFRFLTGS